VARHTTSATIATRYSFCQPATVLLSEKQGIIDSNVELQVAGEGRRLGDYV